MTYIRWFAPFHFYMKMIYALIILLMSIDVHCRKPDLTFVQKMEKLGIFFKQELMLEKCTFVSQGEYYGSEGLPFLKIDGKKDLNVKNQFFQKCFIFLTSEDKWDQSLELIEKVSQYFNSYPLFVVIVHWNTKGSYSILEDVNYPIIQFTMNEVTILVYNMLCFK